MNESKTVTELVSNVKRKVFNERQKARSSVKKQKNFQCNFQISDSFK